MNSGRSSRSQVRADMKTLLANLDQRWVKAASGQVCEQLKLLLESERLRSKSRILAWTSFFPGEVDLSVLISELSDEKTFYLPRSHSDGSMRFISIGDDWTDDVEPGLFGIPEPATSAGNSFDPDLQAFETIVLVPALAFDSLGNRLGRGKGYYDRFLGLPGMQDAKKVGVIWNLQLVEKIPPESHDIPVDYVCSEDGFFSVELS